MLPPARALLARIPASTVVDLDAGCCGMAGSFGYAKEHYEVSRQIGERKLLPAARAMQGDTALVAPGTSCREQVKHFTGVNALHPAQLLQSLLLERKTSGIQNSRTHSDPYPPNVLIQYRRSPGLDPSRTSPSRPGIPASAC